MPRPLRRYRGGADAFGAMRAQIVVRSRYAEDLLAQARRRDCCRYVLLGAGLDTFAFRQPQPAIAVLEIDHPATQRWKRQLLARRGIAEPAVLDWLAVDFERSTLEAAWIDAPGPELVAWLGTTYYLTRAALERTLAVLAERTKAGSGLVLDYWREPPVLDASAPLLWGTRLAVALQQEPMHSFFTPEEIVSLAEASGWRVREHLSPRQQNQRYLARRSDRLRVPSFAHLLHLER